MIHLAEVILRLRNEGEESIGFGRATVECFLSRKLYAVRQLLHRMDSSPSFLRVRMTGSAAGYTSRCVAPKIWPFSPFCAKTISRILVWDTPCGSFTCT